MVSTHNQTWAPRFLLPQVCSKEVHAAELYIVLLDFLLKVFLYLIHDKYWFNHNYKTVIKYLFFCLCLSVLLSVFVCLSFYFSLCGRLSVSLSVCFFLSICWFACLSLSVCLSLSLSVQLSLSLHLLVVDVHDTGTVTHRFFSSTRPSTVVCCICAFLPPSLTYVFPQWLYKPWKTTLSDVDTRWQIVKASSLFHRHPAKRQLLCSDELTN